MAQGKGLTGSDRRRGPLRRLSALLLAGALGWSRGGLADEAAPDEPIAAPERWTVCTDAAALPRQLAPVAARIAARVDQQDADVLVNVVPLDEGSAEFLLASTAEVLAQLRNALVARRVPYRRVDFQWRLVSAASAANEANEANRLPDCRGVVVLIEMSGGDS